VPNRRRIIGEAKLKAVSKSSVAERLDLAEITVRMSASGLWARAGPPAIPASEQQGE
jgi:hypothetical protein